MATSVDGYIAKQDGNSDWVSEADVEIFESKIAECWGIIIGNTTFTQYEDELYPVEWVTNIVISRNSKNNKREDTSFVSSVEKALELAEEKWLQQVLLVWWRTINGSFLQENKIDEIILSVHPIILWDGIKLFENIEIEKDLELIDSKNIQSELVQINYKVKK